MTRLLPTILRVLLLMTVVAVPAFADEIVLPVDQAPIDDPLHGFCGSSYGSSSCTDIGFITPFHDGAIDSGFGFVSDPGSLSGSHWLVSILVPNSSAGAGIDSFTVSNTAGTVSGNTANDNVSATLKGLWTTGDLAAFLGLPGPTPSNKFNAFAVGADAGVTGFFVYVADLGPMTLLNQPAAIPGASPLLTLGGSPLRIGTEITSFLVGSTTTIATAPSSVLQAVPEPSTLLLFATGVGVLAVGRRRLAVNPR